MQKTVCFTTVVPLTIVFFSGIFTSKAIEKSYTRKELVIFGLSTGSATFLFMGLTVILISLLKQTLPVILVRLLNLIAGLLITGYGIIRIFKLKFAKKILIGPDARGFCGYH